MSDESRSNSVSSSVSSKNSESQSFPASLDQYQIKKKIGSGGMGTVFLAQDVTLKRMVALKVLSQEKAENTILVQRFQSEAKAAAALEHPNIVRIYGSGNDKGYYYIALEYVDGIDLHQLVKKRTRLPVRRSLQIIVQATKALYHAHEMNIVHRDIKPSNFLIDKSGNVKLTDMGLARSLDDEEATDITRAGTTVGTVDYMSPEQARNSRLADIRSDIYSLGCTWYQMLTGSAPFSEGSMTNKLHAHATKVAPDPRDVQRNVPEGIVAILHRMMEKKPEQRYQNPKELLEDLMNSRLTRKEVQAGSIEALALEGASDPEGIKGQSKKATAELPARTQSKKRKPRKEVNSDAETKIESDFPDSTPSGDLPPRHNELSGTDEKVPAFSIEIMPLLIFLGIVSVVGTIAWFVMTAKNDTPLKPQDNQALIDRLNQNKNNTGNDPNGKTNGDGNSSGDLNPIGEDHQPKKNNPDPVPTNPPFSTPREKTETQTVAQFLQKHFADPALQVFSFPAPKNGASAEVGLKRILEQLPEKGGIIEVTGKTPYLFTDSSILKNGRVILKAKQGVKPLFLFKPKNGTVRNLFQVQSGFLELNGIHIVTIQNSISKIKTPIDLFSVSDGHLYLQNGSFTQVGDNISPTTVVALMATASPKTAQTKTFVGLERCVVRGEKLGVIRSDSHRFLFGCTNSLILSGRANVFKIATSSLYPQNQDDPMPEAKPALIIDENKSSNNQVNKDKGDKDETKKPALPKSKPTERFLQIQNCNIATALSPFLFTNRANLKSPPRTKIRLIGTRLHSIGTKQSPQAAPSSVVEVRNWSPKKLKEKSLNQPSRLRWKIEDSDAHGFEVLASVALQNSPVSIVAKNAAEWQKLWNSRVEGQILFPETLSSKVIVSAPMLGLKQIDSSLGLAQGGVKQPGIKFKVDSLFVPEVIHLERKLAESQKPNAPIAFFNEKLAEKIDIEIKSSATAARTLERKLKASQGKKPILVTITGSGKLSINPISIEGKRVKIRFQHQGEGIQILPKTEVYQKEASSGKKSEAMFIVKNGSIEFENLQLKIHDHRSKLRRSPEWFLSAIDADFAFRNCIVNSAMDCPNQKGLIQWRQSQFSKKRATRPFVGVIKNSLLRTQGSVIDAQMLQTKLFLENSILAGTSHCIASHFPDVSQGSNSTISITHCSIAANVSHLQLGGKQQFEKKRSIANTQKPLTCFVDQSIFVPLTLPTGKSKPVAVEFSTEMTQHNQLQWWGNRNGFSNSLLASVPSKQNLPLQQPWKATWKQRHTSDPLLGNRGVLLQKPVSASALKELSKVNFELLKSSQASTWSMQGGRIGANTTLIRFPKSGSTGTGKKPPKTLKPLF